MAIITRCDVFIISLLRSDDDDLPKEMRRQATIQEFSPWIGAHILDQLSFQIIIAHILVLFHESSSYFLRKPCKKRVLRLLSDRELIEALLRYLKVISRAALINTQRAVSLLETVINEIRCSRP